jgi:hypothetical protein
MKAKKQAFKTPCHSHPIREQARGRGLVWDFNNMEIL